MHPTSSLPRRRFITGLAAAAGALGVRPPGQLLAAAATYPPLGAGDEYDALVKLANNENNYGPSDAVIKAMTQAFKYSNRYGYPDGGLVNELAAHHDVKPEHILLAAGSGEILDVACSAFLQDQRKIVGSDPSYSILYAHATGLKSDTLKIPLLSDYRQDIPSMIQTTRAHWRDVGFVYLCNPNNPTGRLVTSAEVRQLLDGVPPDVPVLIDEAYHHFVDDASYTTSVPYVREGRQVIVARTFSKIAALAGMRLGYAIAPPELLQRMRAHMTGTVNAVVRWGGVASLKDTERQAWVKKVTLEQREKTARDLNALGFATIPSDTNFFMVHLKRPVQPVIEEFRKRGIQVGRPFPPMTEHLRVSVGTPEDMQRFTATFREIMGSAGGR